MTLQQLEYFLAAADHRSFSAAAAALHMAQPSLSEQIRRLEAELGAPLFVRAPPARADRGRPALPARGRAHARGGAGGARLGPRGARARERHRDVRHLRQRAVLPALRPRPGLPQALSERARAADRPELLGGRRGRARRPPRGRADRAPHRRPRPRRAARRSTTSCSTSPRTPSACGSR